MKQSWIDLNALEAFVAVADTGTFTGGAKSLGESKVAVSRRITALEGRLGEKLLTRTTRSVRTTEAGVAVRARADAVFASARDLADAVAASSRDPSGRLRIASSQLLYEMLLEPVVLPFVARHARIQLALDVVPDPVLALRAGYDLALVVGPAPDSSMGSLFLGRAKMGCYASETYLGREGSPKAPADLAAHAVAVIGSYRPLTWIFSRGARRVPVTITPRLSCVSHDLVLRAVAAGIAVARLPHFYVRRSDLATRVVPVLPEWSTPAVPAYAVFPNRDRPSPTVRAFLAQLRDPLRTTQRRLG